MSQRQLVATLTGNLVWLQVAALFGLPVIWRPALVEVSLHDGRNTSADGEFSYNLAANRFAGDYQIIQDLVDDMLIENPLVAKGEKVELERLQLEDPLIGHVSDPNCSEIGLPCLGAKRGELGAGNIDFVLAARVLVRKRL